MSTSVLQFMKAAAEKDERPEPGFVGREMARYRASTGPSRIIREKGQLKKLYIGGAKGAAKGLVAGGAVGGLLGAATGGKGKRMYGAAAGAGLGGLFGALVGDDIGSQKAIRDDLREKGVHTNAMGVVKHLTPEARAKYLHHRYAGGGVGKKD